MKNALFTGACTALVTPFHDGKLNIPMLEKLLARQLESGIRAIVICGTTGEASTLSDMEKIQLFSKAKTFVGDSAKILAGTGSNDTVHSITMSKAAEDVGADGVLIVSPYYNKATTDGLFTHYSAIAAAVHIPVVVYNVPSRTGLDIPVSVYQALSKISNIAGIKEASGDISKTAKTIAACPKLPLWSGNDNQIVPVMALGGMGVISVLSNVLPVQTQAMALAALDGDFDTAAALQAELMPLIDALFCEVNPIPVKAAMEMLGYDCGPCRLPLTSLSEKKREVLKNLLSAL